MPGHTNGYVEVVCSPTMEEQRGQSDAGRPIISGTHDTQSQFLAPQGEGKGVREEGEGFGNRLKFVLEKVEQEL